MKSKPATRTGTRTASRKAKAKADGPAIADRIEREIGPRIANVRRRAALTLEELAGKTGFTKGYLSRIENSRVIPPIGTLVRVTSALGMGIPELLASEVVDPKDDRVVFVERGGAGATVHGGRSFGYDYVALASRRNGRPMTPFVMIFPEGVYTDVRFDHEGDEFVYLLQGRIAFEVVVDGQPRFFMLRPGDSLYFDSTLPHRGRSLRGESRALIVVNQAGKRR